MPRDLIAEVGTKKKLPKDLLADIPLDIVQQKQPPLGVAKETALGTLKALAIPPAIGAASRRMIERPEESAKALGLTFGITQFPASLGLSYLAGKQFERPGVKRFVGEAQRKIAEEPIIRGAFPRIPTGLTGTIARKLKPEQFEELTKGLAETGVFVTSAGLRLDVPFKKVVKGIGARLPRIMGKDYLRNRAIATGEGLEGLYKGLSDEYDVVYNKIGNRVVELGRVQDIVDDLPQIAINRIAKSKLVEKTREKAIWPTLKNLKEIKTILRNTLPKGVRSGRMQATPEQGQVKYALERIHDLMAEGNPELVALNQRYRNFMNLKSQVGDIVYDKFGNPKSAGLANLFKPGAERAKQISFENLAKIWPAAQQVMRDAAKFSRRQLTKRWLGRIALIGGGYEIARRGLRPLFEGLGGGGGGEQGGGGY